MLQGPDKFFDTARDWQRKHTGMSFKMHTVEGTREVFNNKEFGKNEGAIPQSKTAPTPSCYTDLVVNVTEQEERPSTLHFILPACQPLDVFG